LDERSLVEDDTNRRQGPTMNAHVLLTCQSGGSNLRRAGHTPAAGELHARADVRAMIELSVSGQ
jgi:hypothetical protein